MTTMIDPARDGFAVTPNDSADIRQVRSLYVGGAGDVAIRTSKGTSLTFTAVPAGTVLPVLADRVLATGTTATSIIGLL